MGPSRQPNTDFLTAVTAVAYNILGNHGLAATTRMPCAEPMPAFGMTTRFERMGFGPRHFLEIRRRNNGRTMIKLHARTLLLVLARVSFASALELSPDLPALSTRRKVAPAVVAEEGGVRMRMYT